MNTPPVQEKTVCIHCGSLCETEAIVQDDKHFCCNGCATVYNLLNENNLCSYYELDAHAGVKIKATPKDEYAYLDNDDITAKLLNFREGNIAKVQFHLPDIHCNSCIFLLENLYKIRPGILQSRVHFVRKDITLTFCTDLISLRAVVELMAAIGYPPHISLQNYTQSSTAEKEDRRPLYKIGIAGFCAANIMLLSFPEYLGLDASGETGIAQFLGYINLLLALPVVFYGASDYYIAAFQGLKSKVLTLDVPICIGITAVFCRSVYEVLSHTGPGYFDSLTGLTFFLLIGRWYRQRVYRHFSFERDYLSYFPIAVMKVDGDEEKPVPTGELKPGDTIRIRHGEIIPADAELLEGKALIDYSFVTGESNPVEKPAGELIYAGGRQTDSSILLRVRKEVSQSYLLQLWNMDVFSKPQDAYLSAFILRFSKYFTYGTLIIAALTLLYRTAVGSPVAMFAFTSVLLVACPCAIALSLPFAFSNGLRLLSKKGLYLKNTDSIEKLTEVDAIVFDKTGTLTQSDQSSVSYIGLPLRPEEQSVIISILSQSTHPLSRTLALEFSDIKKCNITGYKEVAGSGMEALHNNIVYRIGSPGFMGPGVRPVLERNGSSVFVQINGELKGYYSVKNSYRPGVEELLRNGFDGIPMYLLSGDGSAEKDWLSQFIPEDRLYFNQSPTDKLQVIQKLQQEGKTVLMLGDGLNDAGALKAADVGIAISDDTCRFSPACDGIMEGGVFRHLRDFFNFSRGCVNAVKITLVLSLLYNVVGLSFAVQGLLSPLVAAILMPVSSVSVVLFVIAHTNYYGRKFLKN